MKTFFNLMTILLLSLSQLTAQPIPHVYNPSGFDRSGPNLNEAAVLGNNCFNLTTNTNQNLGGPLVAVGVWDQTPINLNNNNDISIIFNLGNANAGGDGISMVFQNQGTTGAIGGGGGFLGIPAANSLAVEVDVFNNGAGLGDIPADHVALVLNGNQGAPANVAVNSFPNGANLEDGNNHTLLIMWRPLCSNLQQITVFIDGQWQFRTRGDFINTAFGGNPIVNWGLMGAKGNNTNTQAFCFNAINVSVANITNAIAQIEDAQSVPRNQFICGEDVFLNGSASTNYNSYRIQIRQRDINSAPSDPYSWVGSMPFQGNINTVNLSELAAQNLNFDFDPNREYHITLVVQSNAPCNWITDEQTFTVIDGGVYEADFHRQAIGEFDGTVTVNTIAFDQSPSTISVSHQWRLFFAGPNGETNLPSPVQVPGTLTYCCNSTTATYQGLNLDTWYFVRHGIWNECTGWKEKRKSFKVSFGPESTSERPKYQVVYGSDNGGSDGGQSTGTDGYGLGKYQFTDDGNNLGKEDEINISIIPNPIQQDQEFTIKADMEISKVEIIDINGKIQSLNKFSGLEKQASVTANNYLQAGIYFVRVYLRNGGTELRKLVVH